MKSRCAIFFFTLLLFVPVLLAEESQPKSEPKNRIAETGNAPEGTITQEMIRKMADSFRPDGSTRRLADSVVKNQLKNIALNQQVLRDNNPYFSHEIRTAKITDQRGSGRCWMFAGFNVLRPAVVKKIQWDEFEFSESYLFFWDKMEKANVFLERVIDRRNLDERSERYQRILKEAAQDGGWWEYFTYLIRKYGAVPKSAMPETEGTINSGQLNRQLTDTLHACAARIHRMAAQGKEVPALREEKEKGLRDVYRILVFHLGKPPEEFSFRYKSKKEEEEKMAEALNLYHAMTKEAGKEDFVETEAFKELAKEKVSLVKTYTPRSFAEEFVLPDLGEYVNLGNIPGRALDTNYVMENSRAMVEGEDVRFLNVSIDDLRLATLQSVLADDPVWFGADVGRQVDSESGIMHPDLYRYADVYGIDVGLSKADRLLYGDIDPNHAMVFMGVDYVDGKVVKWLVENSWGEKPGRTGLFHMYDGWFDQYVLMTIVKKKYLPKRLIEELDKKPVLIKEEDPLAGQLFYSR